MTVIASPFQALTKYNLNYVSSSNAFKLAVDIEPVSMTDQCSVATVSPCISYAGPGPHSNMAILEVAMPSGYEPDRASLFLLAEQNSTSNVLRRNISGRTAKSFRLQK